MAHPAVILVVSDFRIRHFLSLVLRKELNVAVKAFGSCTDAMLAFDPADMPAAIIFDATMPDGNDGNDLLHWRNQRFPQVPAVVMTYAASSLKEPGATAILKKPFSPEALVKTIASSIGLTGGALHA